MQPVLRIIAIARNTAREAIRNKVLYSILVFAIFVAGIAALFGTMSIGDPMKFVKDFSLMSVSLFGVTIAVVLGVNLLSKEIGKRTIYNILSKPVARWEFVIGKFLGLFGTLALVVAAMSAALVGLLALIEQRIDWGLVAAGAASLLELMIIVAVALFFSSIVVTPALAGLLTVGVFIVGRSCQYLYHFVDNDYPARLRATARTLYWLAPHLHQFNLADVVVYGNLLDIPYFLWLVVYAISYSGVLLILSVAVFSRREFA